ncbi:MAG TPA: DNA repair protein RadC [Bacteroidales bacterium]|nr:DNA repair protein RadC [Bacteroidales bacterium]HNS46197.1 DNA repair protein RadC [Bacteroidales bacterium]
MKHIPISRWAEEDRPREKLMLKGKHSLSDAELLAILIGTGSREHSALDLAKEILTEIQNNLIELSKLQVNELVKFQGIGHAKAITIIAALELGRRRRGSEVIQRKKIQSSRDVFELFQVELAEKKYEGFWLLLLDRANKIVGQEKISEGGTAGTVADPKRIFKVAIDRHASSLILCHNHPSGNVEPSQADISLTKKMIHAGTLLDIQILDHIIIGEENYFSFADENMMT